MKSPTKLPTREPRKLDSALSLEIPYYDHETVIQDDGTIAVFRYNSGEHEKGWVHKGYNDEFGFTLVGPDEDQNGWYLKNAFDNRSWPKATEVAAELGPKIIKTYFDRRGETLFKFRFGDVLSMRGGYFVVHDNAPEKIIRIIQTEMS